MDKIIIKNEEQIKGIRKSCQLAAKTLDFIKPKIQVGITTGELDNLMDKFIRDNNAIPAPLGYKVHPGQPPYPKSTCISLNEVVCHGIPDNTIIKEGDIVSIDVTTILDGYYGDTAITFPIGKISDEASYLLNIAKKCLDIGIKQVKPGKNTGEIGYHIHSYTLLQGCTVVEQFCGHGVGLLFHEPPQIMHICDKNDGVVMFPGMIFTIEPMINLGIPDVVIDNQDQVF